MSNDLRTRAEFRGWKRTGKPVAHLIGYRDPLKRNASAFSAFRIMVSNNKNEFPVAVESTTTALRLDALASYGILDTPAEQTFDDIVHLAADLCGTASALVSLVADDRQWFKARLGFDACQTPIEQSVCAHALDRPGLLVIPDLSKDPRTQDNTLVTEAPFIRFYAGVRLETPDGIGLGTLCVIDGDPRPEGLTDRQADGLQRLARQVMTQLQLRRVIGERDAAAEEVQALASGADAIRRDVAERLRKADERLQIALLASGVIGLWDWMVDTDLLHGDANFARLYGLEPGKTASGLTMEEYQEFVVHEDLAGLRASIRRTFERGDDFLVEYRLAIPAQPLRWVECKGRMIYDHEGIPVRFSGSAIDITARKHAEEQNRRLAAIVEQSSDFIGVARLDGSVQDVNDYGRRLVGLDRENVSKTRIQDYFDPEQWPTIAAKVFPAVDRDGHWRGELRFRHFVTGELIPVIYDVIALRDENDAVTAYATVTRDIREQKKAEARQQVLNQELSHRLKNSLAMVSAIAMQTLKGEDIAERRAAFNARLDALAKAQDILTATTWQGAPILSVIEGALTPHVSSKDRLVLDGPNIHLSAKQALSMSLTIHELATNAAKYGALAVPGGTVHIRWTIDNEEFRFVWRESGGPQVAEPTRKGFGSRMITRVLSADFDGKVGIEYAPEGVICTLASPANSVGAMDMAPTEYEAAL